MLDIKLIREKPDHVKARLATRGLDADIAGLLDQDARRRACIAEVDQLKNERNLRSKEIGALIKSDPAGAAAKKEAVRVIGDRIAELDRQQAELDEAIRQVLLSLPNLPHASVPVGRDSTENRLVKVVGSPAVFDFQPQCALGPRPRSWASSTSSAGPRSPALGFPGLPRRAGSPAGARSLINFMLDLHTGEHGYTEMEAALPGQHTPPCAAPGSCPSFPRKTPVPQSGWTTSVLIPTAEVPVTNLHPR
jgi:seryl-tRNA synthetase